MSRQHPCVKCGACCAFFRVEFYWREIERDLNPVPEALTVAGGKNSLCMQGTQAKHHPKCVALNGRVGKTVACSIYANRPSVCRKFEASYESGQKNERCDQARRKHGLAPLRREDWLQFNEENPSQDLPPSG